MMSSLNHDCLRAGSYSEDRQLRLNRTERMLWRAIGSTFLAGMSIVAVSEVKGIVKPAQAISIEVSPSNKVVEALPINKVGEVGDVPAPLTQAVLQKLISEKGLTPLGASYLTGNFIQESRLDPTAKGDYRNGTPTAHGIAQWRFDRLRGMPSDLMGQIDFALDVEMERDHGARDLPELLRDPAATPQQLMDGLKRWERWGVEADRFEYAQEIYTTLTSPD
jgi:hypothetical protein